MKGLCFRPTGGSLYSAVLVFGALSGRKLACAGRHETSLRRVYGRTCYLRVPAAAGRGNSKLDKSLRFNRSRMQRHQVRHYPHDTRRTRSAQITDGPGPKVSEPRTRRHHRGVSCVDLTAIAGFAKPRRCRITRTFTDINGDWVPAPIADDERPVEDVPALPTDGTFDDSTLSAWLVHRPRRCFRRCSRALWGADGPAAAGNLFSTLGVRGSSAYSTSCSARRRLALPDRLGHRARPRLCSRITAFYDFTAGDIRVAAIRCVRARLHVVARRGARVHRLCRRRLIGLKVLGAGPGLD